MSQQILLSSTALVAPSPNKGVEQNSLRDPLPRADVGEDVRSGLQVYSSSLRDLCRSAVSRVVSCSLAVLPLSSPSAQASRCQ